MQVYAQVLSEHNTADLQRIGDFTPDERRQYFPQYTFKFQWKSFAITIIVSIIVGQMSGLILNADWRMSLLAEYAGSDFLESLYKIRFAQFFKVV